MDLRGFKAEISAFQLLSPYNLLSPESEKVCPSLVPGGNSPDWVRCRDWGVGIKAGLGELISDAEIEQRVLFKN